jgi:regulator of protease activity HflC (stomatin/prohibitin superfamily)
LTGIAAFVGFSVLLWNFVAFAYTSASDLGVIIAVIIAVVYLAAVFTAIYAVVLYARERHRWAATHETVHPDPPPPNDWPSAAVVLVLILAATGCTRVEPGYEGIKVHMLGSERANTYPIVYGRVWYNPWTEDIYEFPLFVQRVVWTAQEGEGSVNDDSFTFRSKEGYAFNVDVGMGLQFNQGKTPGAFIRYRRVPEDIIQGPFRDTVREAFVSVGSQMEGLSILGPGMVALNQGVTKLVQEELKEFVTVEYVNVVGKPRVDARVEQAINAVIQATQQANEAQERVRMREAEARQQVATANGNAESLLINAKAKADAIRIEAEALRQFGAQVLQMRAIERWNGTMPMVVGEGAMPFINVPRGNEP